MLLTLLLSTAHAGDLSVGVGVSGAMDLPDRVSSSYATPTRFGPGPSLEIPIRYDVAKYARLRATLRGDLGFGNDRVTWTQSVDGTDQTFYDDDHWAMLAAFGATGGVEVLVPGDLAMSPYLGVEAGVAHVGTYHALGGTPAAVLIDPDQNDVGNPKNVDPFTSQTAFLTDVHAGAYKELSDSLGFFVEAGYSLAYVPDGELAKAPADLHGTRAAYGWNAARLGVGISFAL